jgi:hypothetical protein
MYLYSNVWWAFNFNQASLDRKEYLKTLFRLAFYLIDWEGKGDHQFILDSLTPKWLITSPFDADFVQPLSKLDFIFFETIVPNINCINIVNQVGH